METAKKGRPFGFYVCALGFTFERFAFYTMKYLLAIWIATAATSGGLGLSDIEGSAVSGSFVAWTYITPIIGGYIADHWISPRICVALGMLLMGIGYIILYFASTLAMVNVMIAFVAVGTGLFKGNLQVLVGNLYDVMGVEHLSDLGQLLAAAQTGRLDEDDLMRTAMRIGPNMTLWGPLALPEQAESMGPAVELLLGTLRSEADVVLVDTATSWSDAVAAAVAMSDRCLMIGGSAPSTVTSLTRIMELAARIGVPRTRMTSVFNRLGAPGCGEDDAMRFEVSVALGSRARVADGGNDVRELMSFGNTAALLDRPGPFSASLKALTRDVLLELGCSVGEMTASEPADPHTRLRLPWHKVDGGAS